MVDENWRTIKIPNELAIKIEKIIVKEGFNSKSDFVTQAIRELVEKYKKPRFEHINFHENVIRLIDNHEPKSTPFVEIYLNDHHLKCDSCQSQICEHIDYAWQDPKIKQQLQQKNIQQNNH